MTDQTTHQQARSPQFDERAERLAFAQWDTMTNSLSPAMSAFVEGDDRNIHPNAIDRWEAWKASALRASQGNYPAAPESSSESPRWISVRDRMPPDGDEVLVCVDYDDGSGPYVMLDRWAMHHEDPLGMGGPTIETGFDWDNNDPHDVSHWMPLPAAPSPGAEGVVKQDLTSGGPT
ncbi:DUF551 domain-containing protein [Roseateles sp.]|uniref:DUF551 domain-containing protein n=1 Tax=Roseateles sp. TaxID=1971397 RepID=UPI0031D62F5F